MKLSNWKVSWQEVLCYNPRSYAVTPAFEENYLVMRQGIENFISHFTDIVFVVSIGGSRRGEQREIKHRVKEKKKEGAFSSSFPLSSSMRVSSSLRKQVFFRHSLLSLRDR